jgi:hypothetical protein
MHTRKRYLRLLILLIVLLAVTSAGQVQSAICFPPQGTCYSYCVRPATGTPYCMGVSFDYFCAPISGGCYSTAYCDYCAY